MHISKPELHNHEGSTSVRARVTSSLGQEWVRFTVPADQADALAYDTADQFMIGLLPVAMALGEDMEISAPVSKTLLFNMNHGYLRLLEAMIPTLNNIQIIAEGTDVYTTEGATVATGMSGGVDSSHTITQYFFADDVPDSMRVSQLLFFNVGSNGERDQQKTHALFLARQQHLKRMAERVGLPLLPVDSNLADQFNAVGINYESTVTLRNVSAALAVQSRVRRYLAASGPTWANSSYGAFHESLKTMEKTDPFSLPLVRTERFDAFSVGGELSRGEKIEVIANQEFVQEFIMPCVRPEPNCGICNKCVSTQLPLEIIGKLDKYDRVFDLSVYRKVRDSYLARINLARNNPGLLEMAQFAADRNYSLRPRRTAYVRQIYKELKSRSPERLMEARRRAIDSLKRTLKRRS